MGAISTTFTGARIPECRGTGGTGTGGGGGGGGPLTTPTGPIASTDPETSPGGGVGNPSNPVSWLIPVGATTGAAVQRRSVGGLRSGRHASWRRRQVDVDELDVDRLVERQHLTREREDIGRHDRRHDGERPGCRRGGIPTTEQVAIGASGQRADVRQRRRTDRAAWDLPAPVDRQDVVMRGAPLSTTVRRRASGA